MKIGASFEKSCIEKGGIYLVYKSLKYFDIDLLIQDKQIVNTDKEYDLIIGFGHPSCMPPEGKYKRGMVYASPMLQTELSGELTILLFYINQLKIKKLDYLFITDESLAMFLKKQNQELNIFWLPICDFRDIKMSEEKRLGAIVTGAFRSNKNYINQLMGLIDAGEEDILMIGNDKSELSRISSFAFNKDIKYIKSLSSYDEVLKEVSKRKYLMQVSLSESFCYSVYEACMLGVPSITSYSVGWYRGNKIDKYCLVRNADSLEHISFKVSLIRNMGEEDYFDLSHKVRFVAEEKMTDNKYNCRELFYNIRNYTE